MAGNGTSGYTGDNGPATSAQLSYPVDLALDGAGNLYIADMNSNCVRKVDTKGIITTVAGIGRPGYSGDDGPAMSAELYYPIGVTVDSIGNLYIADSANNRIRKVDVGGTIMTFAGNGAGGCSGDGGKATDAKLNFPRGVALDGSGNLYIADNGNNRVRKVDAGGTITTVAGNGAGRYSGDGGKATDAELNHPIGVTVDDSCNLFIADYGNDRVRKVDATGTITTVAGNGTHGYSGDNGPVTGAELSDPVGVALDKVGSLYIADYGSNRIRKVDAQGTITTVAGDGNPGYFGDTVLATRAGLKFPTGVTVDKAGTFNIADTSHNRIHKVDARGIITTVAGNGIQGYSGDNGPATSAELYNPEGLALDTCGNLYFVDMGNNRIRKVDTRGAINTVAGNGSNGYSGDGGPAINAELGGPGGGLAADNAGNLYIAEMYNNRIRKVDTQDIITTVAGNGTAGFSGDDGPALDAELNNPQGLAVDNAGNLYIADMGNNLVRKVDVGGTITTVAGDGNSGYSGDNISAASAELNSPYGLAVDAASNLYIADTYNNRIRKVDTKGVITTVAGNGTGGYAGDDGPAIDAELFWLAGLALDNAGCLYIADLFNDRIRKVCIGDIIPPTTPISLMLLLSRNGINLTWSSSTDNVSVIGYEVERSTDKVTWSRIAMTSSTECSDSPPANRWEYYRARAFDAAGNYSGYSNVAKGIIDTTPPATPTMLSASVKAELALFTKSIDLSWSGASDNVGLKTFTIERSIDRKTGGRLRPFRARRPAIRIARSYRSPLTTIGFGQPILQETSQ